jgi:predicted DNA-binding protein
MENMERMHRNKKSYYPNHVFVRITDRQAESLKEIKSKTNLNDSDIVREALEQWINTTLHTISEQGR